MPKTWLVVIALLVVSTSGCALYERVKDGISKPDPKKDPNPGPTTHPAPKETPKPGGNDPVGSPTGGTPKGEEKPVPVIAREDQGRSVFGQYAERNDALKGEVFRIDDGTAQLPNFDNLGTPDRIVYLRSIDIPSQDLRYADESNLVKRPPIDARPELFAVRYTGKFESKKDANYSFRLASDDGSRLLVDGELVVDNDGDHNLKDAWGKVHLAAGTHQIDVQYFQTYSYVALQLFASVDGKQERIFDPGFSQ